MNDNTQSQNELWRTEIWTRFSDVDAQGHVNNLAYLEYIQECRVQWFRSLALGERYRSVVVNTNIEYLQEMFYPVLVNIAMFSGKPGRTSLETHYEIRAIAEEEYLAARGSAKIVFFDPVQRKAVPIPGKVREITG